MTELVIPPWITPVEESIQLVDDNTVQFEPQFSRGLSQRQDYGAPRFKISRRHIVRQGEAGNVLGLISAARGKQIALRSTINQILRGTFALSELLTNNSFVSGTTGWTVTNSALHRVNDRISTIQIAGAQNGTVGSGYLIGRSFTTSQYSPYVARSALNRGLGAGSLYALIGGSIGAGDIGNSSLSSGGLVTCAGVATGSSESFATGGLTQAGDRYQDFILCAHTSAARCALVDNGSNQLLRSDNFSDATWTKTNVTIGSGGTTGYDLNLADTITETAANAIHTVSETFSSSSSQVDISCTFIVKAGLRTFCAVQLLHAGGGAIQYFNLSTAAAASAAAGTGWSNLRAKITAKGNGWYACNLTATKTGAQTSIDAYLHASTGDGVISYAGNTGSVAISADRATVAFSSVPTTDVFTTSALAPGSSQQGSTLAIKGLPVSTSGLALAGDFIEVNKELKRLTAALDSDGLGIGVLRFEPEIVRSPADNDPVIFFQPFGKFIVSNVQIRPRVSDVELSYDLDQIYE